MPHRIHVCDDELHITRSIGMKFTRAGHAVTTTDDGQAAWDVIQNSAPNLLITDFQMPRMDGLELCKRIRQLPENADLPIILLTAKGYELDHARLQEELGLRHVLVKPFSLRELLALGESLLQACGPSPHAVQS